jgi:hypothetical protein
MVLLIVVGILGAGAVYSSRTIAQAVEDRSDYPKILDWVEYYLLPSTEVTRYYRDMLWRHTNELTDIYSDPVSVEIAKTMWAIDSWMPNSRALKNGEGDTAVITKEQVDEMTERLMFISDRASPALKSDIQTEMDRLNLTDFVGLTMTEAWVHLHAIWGVSDPPRISDLQRQAFRPTATTVPIVRYSPTEIPAGGEFAISWAVFRDPHDKYGFAYPADWVLWTRFDYGDFNNWMWLCNSGEINFRTITPGSVCVFIDEVEGFNPASSLGETATDCFHVGIYPAPISLIPKNGAHPARAEVNFKYPFMNPQWEAHGVAFQNAAGLFIYMYSTAENMSTPEILALVDSIVLGAKTQVLAPDFQPSGKTDL